jgi:ABC-type phosphate transport system substrate-binding protein
LKPLLRCGLVLCVGLAAVSQARGAAAVQGRGQAPPGGEVIAIIVHRSNPVENLPLAELRQIFMLERQTWPQGRKITLVLREAGQRERVEVLALIVGMSEPEFERHVLFQTFRGNVGWGPRSIRSSAAMQRFVYNAPGAIGHVYASELDGTVKALLVDGLSHDDPRYRLRQRPQPVAAMNQD